MKLTKLEEQIIEATDEKILQEANIIRLDERTSRKRRLNQACLIAAKEANDPIYFKYQKAAKRRLALREQIRQKYATKGKLKLAEYDMRRKNAAAKK